MPDCVLHVWGILVSRLGCPLLRYPTQPLQCVTFNYLIVLSYLLTCVAFYYLIVVSYLLICGMNKMNSVISMTIATCTVSQSLILAYIVVVCITPSRPLSSFSSTHKNMWNCTRQHIRLLTHRVCLVPPKTPTKTSLSITSHHISITSKH